MIARTVCLLLAFAVSAHGQLLDAISRQAESATLVSAPVQTSTSGFNGTGYVDFPASGGSAVWSGIAGGPGGGVNITIRYALGGTAKLEAPLTVNGTVQRVRFAPTGATTWGTVMAFARVNAGAANTITLATDGADIGIVDEITVSQPAPVKVPTRVYWGGFQGMEQLVGAGAAQWDFVRANQDGLLLHGAYWGNPAESPAPATVGPGLAALVAPYPNQQHIYEGGFPGTYPRIDSALGTSNAGSSTTGLIQDINQMIAWGFTQPDISTDFHMYAWQEAMRYHPEWNDEDFFTALCGNWETTTSTLLNPAGADRTTYGWFRQWTEKLAQTFPGIRVTATDSPVYFNFDTKLELGDYNNAWNAWLKLERRGSSVEALWSATGKTWKSLGSVTTTLPSPAYAGLAVTSKNNARLATAKFSSAQVYDYFFQDIGTPGRGGSLTQNPSTFALTSFGDEKTRNGAKDNRFFTYRDWTGDGMFIARVDSLTGSNATRTWPLAGLEIRESLANDARFVSTFVNVANEARLQSRATAATNLTNHVTQTGQSAPKWLKLERVGNLFTASRSDDGAAWTVIGSTTLALNAAVKVGLVADSQVYFESVDATFSNVNFLTTTANNAAWTGQDIGSPGVAGAQTIGSQISVDASGTDIGGTSDQFRFVQKQLAGDGTILTQCDAFADKASASTALDALAKMGLTLRSSLNANAQGVSIFFTPTQGIRQMQRATDGAAAATGSVWGIGEARIVNDLNSNRRTLVHYLTGNDFLTALRDSFPSTYRPNYGGFTTDSPYSGYMKWGGSETFSQAVQHREKIRLYETFLQSTGQEHQLIANDNTSGASSTQAERDAWDSTYKNNSLRSIQLFQLEAGRPNKVLFESWYSGPYTLVPETTAGTFTNLAMTGIKYLKGVGQTLDLSVKRSAEPLFSGGSVQQEVPVGAQLREWRAPTATATETFTVRLQNSGEVDALPVLQVYENGTSGWTISYSIGGVNVSSAITSADGATLTDSATIGQELIAPGATVDLTVSVTAASPSARRSVLIRAFWNPQDPNLAVKDAVQLELLPPNIAPTAANSFATVAPGGIVDVDLWALVSDGELADGALWFGVTGATNGTAVLLADGHTVRFTAAAGYNGPATFTYSVRDAVNDARLMRSYTFEPPDTTADNQATDASNHGDGALTAVGTGAFAYESSAPATFGSTQSQCLRLTDNGASNNAKLATTVTATELNMSTASWTGAAWFKRATRNTTDLIFHVGAGNGLSGSGSELYIHGLANSDAIQLLYYDSANVQKVNFASAAGSVPVNTWHHAAVAWNATGAGNGTFSLYLNGALVGTSASVVFTPNQAQPLSFGGAPTGEGSDRPLNGWLDDCALFSTALGAGEIANLVQMPVATNAGLASSGTVTINADDSASGLIARWPFDGNFADVTGNGWTLTPTGSAAPTTLVKKQGTHSLALDGSSGHANTASMSLGETFTVSAWIFVPSNAVGAKTIVANSSSGTVSGFRLYVNTNNSNPSDGKLLLETANGTTLVNVTSAVGIVAKDQWQHIAAVINRSAGTAALFRNGTQVAAGTIRNDFNNTASLSIGAMTGGGFRFLTNIDDMRVYNRTLTAADIATLINATNIAPTITAIPNQALNEGTNTGALAFTIGDMETAPQHLTLAVSSSNTALVPTANIILGGSAASRTVTVTPAANQLGSATITVTVNDGTLIASGTFVVTVTGSAQTTWRIANFGTTANTGTAADTANPDGDPWTNAQEYVLGTDPNTANPSPLMTATNAGNNITLSFIAKLATGTGYTGLTRLYDVETTTNLANPTSWTGLPDYTNILGNNQTITVTQPISGSTCFYRLKVRVQ